MMAAIAEKAGKEVAKLRLAAGCFLEFPAPARWTQEEY